MLVKITHGELTKLLGNSLGKTVYNICIRYLNSVGQKKTITIYHNQFGACQSMAPSRAYNANELLELMEKRMKGGVKRTKPSKIEDEEPWVIEKLREFIEEESSENL